MIERDSSANEARRAALREEIRRNQALEQQVELLAQEFYQLDQEKRQAAPVLDELKAIKSKINLIEKHVRPKEKAADARTRTVAPPSRRIASINGFVQPIWKRVARRVRGQVARWRGPLAVEAASIADSGVFQRNWYTSQYPDVAGVDPAEHYLTKGHLEGRDPGPYFSTRWYRERYPEIGDVNPLLDYLREGGRAGRDPNPDFSSSLYLEANPDVARAGINPLSHYVRFGRAERRPTSPSRAGSSGTDARPGGDADVAPRRIWRGRPVSDEKWAELETARAEHERAFRESGQLERILALKGAHQGRRAFLIGNGPSIKTQDLTLLKDEITFVSNWFLHHEQFEQIDPKYYCISSHEMFGGWNGPINLNADFVKLVAQKRGDQRFFFSAKFVEHALSTGVFMRDRVWGLIFDRPKFQVDEIGTQNFDLSRCLDDAYTALLTMCVPLCAHLGITDVYMVGCDCDYQIKTAQDPKAYFYTFDKHTSSTTSFDGLQRVWTEGGPAFKAYEIVQREAGSRGVRMWNATNGGKLEALPRVRYEDLVG